MRTLNFTWMETFVDARAIDPFWMPSNPFQLRMYKRKRDLVVNENGAVNQRRFLFYAKYSISNDLQIIS